MIELNDRKDKTPSQPPKKVNKKRHDSKDNKKTDKKFLIFPVKTAKKRGTPPPKTGQKAVKKDEKKKESKLPCPIPCLTETTGTKSDEKNADDDPNKTSGATIEDQEVSEEKKQQAQAVSGKHYPSESYISEPKRSGSFESPKELIEEMGVKPIDSRFESLDEHENRKIIRCDACALISCSGFIEEIILILLIAITVLTAILQKCESTAGWSPEFRENLFKRDHYCPLADALFLFSICSAFFLLLLIMFYVIHVVEATKAYIPWNIIELLFYLILAGGSMAFGVMSCAGVDLMLASGVMAILISLLSLIIVISKSCMIKRKDDPQPGDEDPDGDESRLVFVQNKFKRTVGNVRRFWKL